MGEGLEETEPVDEVDVEEVEDVEDVVEAERLVFFSDAVVAIALTLLALELPVPEGTTNREFLHGLSESRDEYLAFGISFAVICRQWVGHHRFFRGVRLGGRLVGWNLVWLLTMVVTPWATRVITGDGAFAARFTTYAVVQALAVLAFLLIIAEVDRNGLMHRPDAARVIHDGYRRSSVLCAVFLVSIPFAWIVGQWAFVVWARSRWSAARWSARRAAAARRRADRLSRSAARRRYVVPSPVTVRGSRWKSGAVAPL